MTRPIPAAPRRALALIKAGDLAEAARLLQAEAPWHAAAIALLRASPDFKDYAVTLLEELREPERVLA